METSDGLPALVISLDFELHWGVTERVRDDAHPYNANLIGAREVVRQLLSLFSERGIHATWATVGMLFARDSTELEKSKPTKRPFYDRHEVNTYQVSVGDSEETDPIHFALSLIEQIRSTPGQEIGSHTFSHYYCDEPGQDLDDFRADLDAAEAIATLNGIPLRSIVFPRNQVRSEYLPAVKEAGMTCYRGNPPGGMYNPPTGLMRQFTRATRLVDSYINLTGHHTTPWSYIAKGDLADVRASHFLRPFNSKLHALEPLRVRRVKSALRAAARRAEVYHLWWHPHNFGVNLKENMAALTSILDEFEKLKEHFGMQSLTMEEAAARATHIRN